MYQQYQPIWPSITEYRQYTQKQAIKLYEGLSGGGYHNTTIDLDKLEFTNEYFFRPSITDRLIAQKEKLAPLKPFTSIEIDKLPVTTSNHYCQVEDICVPQQIRRDKQAVSKNPRKRRKRFIHSINDEKNIKILPVNSIDNETIESMKSPTFNWKGGWIPDYEGQPIFSTYNGNPLNILLIFNFHETELVIKTPIDLFPNLYWAKLHFLLRASRGYPSVTNIQNFNDIKNYRYPNRSPEFSGDMYDIRPNHSVHKDSHG